MYCWWGSPAADCIPGFSNSQRAAEAQAPGQKNRTDRVACIIKGRECGTLLTDAGAPSQIGFMGPAFFLTQLGNVSTATGAVGCMMASQGLDAFSQSGLYSNHQVTPETLL